MKKILITVLLSFLIYGTAFAQFGGPFGDLDNLVLDTDCSGYTTEGLFCWDTDDDFLYIGTGSGVSAVGSTADDTAYDATTWDNNTDAATKNALRDKFESIDVSGSISTHNTDATAHPGLSAWIVGATSVLTLRNPIVLDEATGNEYAQSLFYQTNKLTSGDDTGQIISMRDTASPGTSYLFRAGVNTDGTVGTHSDRFFVSAAGTASATERFLSNRYEVSGANGSVYSIGTAQLFLNGSTFGPTPSIAMNQVNASGRTYTNTSGTSAAFYIYPTYNQTSGTAANTDLVINRTETAVGSGEQLLADFQVGGTSKFKVRNGGLVINTVQAVTCADSGGAGAQTATITPTSSYVEITNADADGCDITMGETGMGAGAKVDICVVSNAGATVNFADTAGVTELAGAFAADVDDCITLRYGNTTTWREVSRSAN